MSIGGNVNFPMETKLVVSLCRPMTTFSDWLQNEMKMRGLSQSDLAHRAGVTRAAINRVLTETRGAGPDLCVGVARALGYQPDDVFRIAGLLPKGENARTALADQMLAIFDGLPPDVQEQLVYIALGLGHREQSKSEESSSEHGTAKRGRMRAET